MIQKKICMLGAYVVENSSQQLVIMKATLRRPLFAGGEYGAAALHSVETDSQVLKG